MSAKSLFYPEDKTFSNAEEKAFAREELIYNVTEDLLVAMEDAGISKADLARKLSKGRAFVSQILSGQRNMTLGTFSDICLAIGVEPQVRLGKPQKSDNSQGPEWHEQRSAKVRSVQTSNVIYIDDYKPRYSAAELPPRVAVG
jgi:transcriptional regulator with XRE-family HTH domain